MPLPARDCRHQGAVDSGGGRSPSSRRVSPGCYARLETLDGRRWDTVGITGPSHAVIHNLLGQVIARAGELGVARPRIGQRAGQDASYLHPGAAGLEHGALETGLRDGDLDIGAGTAWLWARAQFQASVDTLFIDEAGQMPLASILAVAGAARNLVLIGDP